MRVDTVSRTIKSVTYTKIMLTENLPSHNPYLQAIKISCRHAAPLRENVGEMILLFEV